MVSHAVYVFNCLEEPDAFMCNTIMRSYVNFDDPFSALGFYHERMVGKWVVPNHYAFPLLVKVCAEIGLVREGEKAHARVVKFGFEADLFVRNSLIHMYSVCGRIGDARMVFDAGPDLDLVSWNTMIDGYVKNGEVDVARELFDDIYERDVFSWNSMIAGYVGIGDMEARKVCLRVTYRDVVSWNCMIDRYARTGSVSVAREFFDRIPLRNVVSWNIMLALCVRCKLYSECLTLFDRMIDGGEVKPNEATLVSALTACASLGGLIEAIGFILI
jgi:pentatricopeptide repeat protein